MNKCVRRVAVSALAVALNATLLSSPGVAGTVLGDAAAGLSPGQWVQLSTTGISAALLDQVSGGVQNILPYADKLHWDPVSSRIYLMNSDDPGDGRRFVAYDLLTNAWLVLPDPWSGSGVAHQYGLVDIDVTGRRIYSIMPDGSDGTYFNLTTSTFTSFSIPSSAYSCCGAAALFPERDSLVYAHGSRLRERRNGTGQWSDLSSSINTSYHSIAHYNPVHKLVVFGGGNDSSRTFYKLSQNGSITTLKQPPLNLESPRVEFVVNPVTGNYLVFGMGKKLYSYDPILDAWTSQSTTSVPVAVWSGTEFGANLLTTVATVLPSHGAAFFVSCAVGGGCSVHLYKFGSATAAPGAPANVAVN